MTPVSVVIITFNEEHNIARCLDSVKGIADEIVIVDSFSKDKTKEICLSYGAKFIENKFEGHIQQKNFAITQAKYPHILSLDADEALDEKLRNSISEVKKNFVHDGYYMNRLTNYCGKWVHHSGWYPDTKLRLWDSRKGQWAGVNPHDKYELTTGDSNTGKLQGDILHYSYYTVEEHYKQAEYFADIAAKSFFKMGKKASFFKLLINPIAKFLHHYIVHFGFLDGRAGFTIAKISAWSTYLKYRKLRELSR
ncbi:MAG: glycosyltransferase family 2 protein [Bacteroidetes bacterium]|nr:glycosyltransferase family 2 protein [Bacteroidota bacterium]MBL0032813.1 glycosyltransferase family 2 protein [Bacteroidota bacterium]MBP6657656.1 glycosyltransferase family 2 protein [Bacteroidia bacterium]